MDHTRRLTLITSVQRALHLVEAVAEHPSGATAKQLAREVGIPLGTAYHLLRTLVYEGYLAKLPDGTFMMADRLETLRVRGRRHALLTRVRPTLTALRDEIGAAVYFATYTDGEVTIVDIADGPRTPRVDLWVGLHDAAHATALGKSILGRLDTVGRAEYLHRHPMAALTQHTITRPARLFAQLDASPGMFFERNEYLAGTGCAAVPVAGALVGSVAVSCSARRLQSIEVARVHAAAARVARAVSLTI